MNYGVYTYLWKTSLITHGSKREYVAISPTICPLTCDLCYQGSWKNSSANSYFHFYFRLAYLANTSASTCILSGTAAFSLFINLMTIQISSIVWLPEWIGNLEGNRQSVDIWMAVGICRYSRVYCLDLQSLFMENFSLSIVRGKI